MKFFFLSLAVLIGLFQLIVFFQNLAASMDASVSYLTEAIDMNPAMIMFISFVLGGMATLSLVLYFTGGKLPIDQGDVGSSGEW